MLFIYLFIYWYLQDTYVIYPSFLCESHLVTILVILYVTFVPYMETVFQVFADSILFYE